MREKEQKNFGMLTQTEGNGSEKSKRGREEEERKEEGGGKEGKIKRKITREEKKIREKK